jgi:ArsR family transcriptional regulator
MRTSEDNIAKIAKALSDKTRLRILKEIAKKGSITCGDAEEIASLSQPTCSHHLKILVEADLLNTEKNGRCVMVSINRKVLDEFGSLISDSFSNK